jgi:hypothetical protein
MTAPMFKNEENQGVSYTSNYGRSEFSYMDVKEASEYTERFRAESMMLIWKLKQSRGAAKAAPVLSIIRKKELMFLERQTSEAIALYKDAKRLYHGLYESYLERLCPTQSYTASLYQKAA